MHRKLSPEWRELLSLIPGYDSESTADPTDWFDEETARLALDFFAELLVFIEGEKGGQPFILSPWQQAVTACLWGWKREDGSRRYRESMVLVPRKNGKSPWVAGLALLSLVTDHEPGTQIYCAAASRDQASVVFRHAVGMVEREPELARRLRVYRSHKTIEYQAEAGIFRALASDAGPLHGLGAQMVIIDELHAHRDSELTDTLVTSTASRRSPLVIYTTTADYQRPSVCNSKYEYACAVRDGRIQDRAFLPVIYEASPNDDWTAEETWRKANPNLGVSVSLDYLRRECAKAKAEPSYEHVFKRLHLNIRTGTATKWISPEAWTACRREMPDLSGRIAYAGMDLSSTQDISAVVLAIPGDDPSDPTWLIPRFYVPEAKLESKSDKVPYREWHRQGLLVATPGNVIDYEFIRKDINELAAQYELASVRFDPWAAQSLATQLHETDGIEMVAMRQGFASMSAPTREFEKRVIAGQIAHDGNPVLAWMLGNVMVQRDAADNLKITKAKSTGRVDGIVATVMALAGAMAEDGGSVYQNRGLLTF